ncbi:hypothetical protein [Idiomarina aminovorans]|uniref:hypothetical protein n=1 Tax=Idiomarina aminovorans TaxID=2914829 RepID=UPI0020050561|nr:hypothetical protein [Idiomarina sp. ATCH4]
MDKNSSSVIRFFAGAPMCLLVAFCCAVGVADAQEKSYSDCAYIEFDDVDPSTLTLQERIALEEAALFASLDESAECMEEATASASGSLADASSGAGAGGSAGSGSSGSSEANPSEQQQQAASTASESSVDTKDHERGNSGSGSSAVCDAVKEGMASATTEAEKEHFKGLMAEYGC